ncbi:MAG: type III-B CRISPR module RAMP protein Cmr6, partial [Myxococcota bacterium]
MRVAGIAAKQGPGSAREAFAGERARREALLATLGARRIIAVGRTPLTLHLARVSALENAGIALHRIGGFAYLPGTGVKGVARAYAELVTRDADEDITRVFGPRLKPGEREGAAAGTVVFHDGWPIEWPTLVVDITNSHHREYYDSGADAQRAAEKGIARDVDPPGDWNSPNPVYFLAVAAGAKFEFAVSSRDPSTSPRDLDLAAEWLRGALAHLGAGAKTAAGYGWMQVENAPERSRGTVARYELELVTPAFLAGAAQGPNDCTLRPSTLRGLLRWWWRTMHVGYLEPKDLYALESVIFGSTQEGQSGFDLVVEPASQFRPAVPPYKDRDFQDQHGIRPRTKEKDGRRKMFGTGVAYVAYGMADGSHAPRYAAEGGARWTLELRFHPDRTITKEKHLLRGSTVSATLIQREVESALFLLCRFGGVGAKARKGFGSIATPPELAALDLDAVRGRAAETREALELDRAFDASRVNGACSLDLLARLPGDRAFIEVPTPWSDPWTAMDRVGQVLQDGAADWAHKEEKAALGLPRAIHGPRSKPMDHQDPATHQPQIRLDGRAVIFDRHSSPVHVSLDRAPSGELVVRVLAFVAGRLAAPRPPTVEKSRAFLEPYLA